MAVSPGDVYDTVRVDASKKRLENLGYFSKVDANPQDTAVPNRKDLVVTVEEQRTGSVTFGAGFSTVDSILGFVEVTPGQTSTTPTGPPSPAAARNSAPAAQYGLRRRDFLLSWTEPWFLDRQISFGFDGFFNDAEYLSSDFNQRRYGGAVRVGKSIDQFWRIGLRYQYEVFNIYNVDDDASDLIKDEEGRRSKSSVRGTLTYDSRDDLFLTRSGEKVEFAAEGAGGPLFGDTKIWKLEAEATKYWSLPYDLILSLGASTAIVDTYDSGDEAVPLYDRLFIGGSNSIRGFQFRDVGPHDDGDPVGGKTMAYSNLEITFPIMDRVRGAIFVDGGFNENKAFEYTLDNLNIGTGIGLRLNLPIGPLRFDLGFPVYTDEDHEVGEMEFHFDVGYQF
ncbi:MAG: BamA/TamA family outer membrane protein [Bdellovibrionaceae bacterium]|nr:BamA/TamA family outer membrane protein [Pseudobdellovibrionaceae bacterium]